MHTLSWIDRKSRKIRCEDGYRQQYGWEVWYPPHNNYHYTAAADVAEGILSDQKDNNSDPDWSVIAIYNRQRNRIDAVWRGRCVPDELGHLLAIGASWYNNAWCTPEINGPGFGTLATLKNYRGLRIYNRQRWEDKRAIDRTDYLGWRTTATTRDVMIDDYIEAIRPDENGDFSDSLDVHSDNLVNEEQVFIWKPNGKREHAASKHDDELFATMIAYQLHKRCPKWGSMQPEMIRAKRQNPHASMLLPGGRDPGLITKKPTQVTS